MWSVLHWIFLYCLNPNPCMHIISSFALSILSAKTDDDFKKKDMVPAISLFFMYCATPDSLTIYSPKKYLKLDVGWFHPCIQCGILTSDELAYMILIRRDYEQITVNCCRVCRSKLSNRWIYSINEIRFTPHKIIRIARLR